MSTILFIMILYSVTNNVIHCDVFYVTPDDDSCCSNSSSCDQCYNLQHYLLNVSKYFTAHTQLYFLPGLHYLSTNLVIQNVSNISLIGTANGTYYTTIQCTGAYHIILSNINSLTIRDLVVTKCGYDISPDVTVAGPHLSTSALSFQTVQLYYCSFVTIINVEVMFRNNYDIIASVNTMGNSTFHNVLSAGFYFIYHDNETIKHHTSVHVLIDNFRCNYRSYFNTLKHRKIIIKLYQSSFTVYIKIVNINLCSLFNIFVGTESGNYNVIEINSCTFSNEIVHNSLPFFDMTGYHIHEENTAIIHFKNCHFINIFRLNSILSLIEISSCFNILNIVDCAFVNTSNVVPLTITKSKNKLAVDMYQNITVLIKNTSFVSNTIISYRFQNLLTVSEQVLLLDGPVLFKGIQLKYGKLIDSSNAVVQFHNYIEISNCSGFLMFADLLFSILKSPVMVNIVHNNFQSFSDLGEHKRSVCIFQYFNEQNLNLLFRNKMKLAYSVIFQANKWATKYELSSFSLRITHCSWLTGSAFNTTIPVDVNQQFISFVNETFVTSKKGLCYCSEINAINCYTDQLGPIYPGQTLNIMLAFRYSSFVELIIDVHDTKLPPAACKISSLQETKQLVTQTCTAVKFTILQTNSHYKWCELIFKTDDVTQLTSNDAFYIKFYPCPAGFSKINGRCQCDPMLTATTLSIDDCDINDQTILRPANSWISATINNNTFTYLVSSDCPFDYCLPYPSRLKLLLTADLQCRFRRHSLLCGQCSDGLSTVFGSSHCQKCSNANIFIIVPIAILGLLLVVLLFLINLTVADGTINAFILYVNILSINSTVFFHSHDAASKAAYIFISILNLDMGIQTCFYDGMDDYAKMWLQLLFPFYLIFIAAILIMTSRYSSRVQRLTARRALPVLATLFLLSYTKILRTVSSVLFFYSSIIHLPSNHIKLVWSVDANVNMFEFRFIALFIVCLVIFILLIPFNITLLFTRSLVRFKLVNYFKPLLDVYQGPFKIKFYYWMGLHLVTKAVFFGLSALDKKVNLLIGSMVLIAIEGICGYIRPYKNWFQNCHEMILVFNLNALCVMVLSGQSVTPVNVMIALAAVQFLFIVIYSIVNYTPAKALKNQIQQRKYVNTMVNKRLDNAIELHNLSYRNRIPEITYNYSEYQEPLVGVD